MIPHDFVPVYRKRLIRRLRRREFLEAAIGFFLLGACIGLIVILFSMFY